MRRVGLALLVALATWVGSCSQRAPRPWVAGVAADDAKKPLVGYLGHRGRLYRIEDVLDPTFRAESDDPFLQDLNPREMWAGP